MDASSEDLSARRKGKRLAHALVTIIAVTFVGASAAQIIPSVLESAGGQTLAASPGSQQRMCAEGMRKLAYALERASRSAWLSDGSPHREEQDGLQVFRASLSPEWDAATATEHACSQSAQGLNAWAALLRLRSAEQEALTRGLAQVVPLREELAAHLPADLR